MSNSYFRLFVATKRFLLATLTVCAGLLFLSALYYSLKTPFALIDDYGDWLVIKHWSQEGGFLNWSGHVFLGDSLGRYRPFFELYNYTTWSFFGPSAPYHHLARWVVKLACLFLGVLTLAIISLPDNPRAFSRDLWKNEALRWSALFFIIVFLFFPNQPVARLAPQELNSVFFLCLSNLAMAMLLTATPGRVIGSSITAHALLFIGSLGLSLTKEINIAILAWIALFLMISSHGDKLSRRLAILFPVLCLLGFTLWRVKVAASDAAYGVTAITGELLLANAKWLYKDVFQFSTSLVLGIMLVILFFWPILYSGTREFRNSRISPRSWFIFFLAGEFLVLFAMLCTSWLQVLRYWYPLIPVLALLTAFTIQIWIHNLKSIFQRTVSHNIVILLCLLFILNNGYNYHFQFTIQHALRQVESKVLSHTGELLEQGQQVYIWTSLRDPDMEINDKVRIYFNHYLPFFFNTSLNLRVTEDLSLIDENAYLLSPRPEIHGFQKTKSFQIANDYPLLDPLYRISATVQQRKSPRLRLDAGVHWTNYAWHVYRKGEHNN